MFLLHSWIEKKDTSPTNRDKYIENLYIQNPISIVDLEEGKKKKPYKKIVQFSPEGVDKLFPDSPEANQMFPGSELTTLTLR